MKIIVSLIITYFIIIINKVLLLLKWLAAITAIIGNDKDVLCVSKLTEIADDIAARNAMYCYWKVYVPISQ